MGVNPRSIADRTVFYSTRCAAKLLPYQAVTTIEGAQQLLPMGPVASQEAIKMLGTNGGGFLMPTRRIRLKTQPH